jgi:DNA-binding winged helix-turn-helix (wHTH) protein
MQLMDPAFETPASVAFGRFRVLPHRPELLADGQPIKLGGRAFDLLMALIEARGTVLEKDALMAQVWPNRIIEEKNLHAQVWALRTALGAGCELIRTVSGRSYQFTGETRILPASPDKRDGAEPAKVVCSPAHRIGHAPVYSISTERPRNCHSLVVPSRVSAAVSKLAIFYERIGGT